MWPTNRDRPAFNAVMAADAAGRLRRASAHRANDWSRRTATSAEQAREWLTLNGPDDVARRGRDDRDTPFASSCRSS